MKSYRVVWDTRAKESLRDITLFIKEESPGGARKVRMELLKLTASLKRMPERFSAEPYLEQKGSECRSVVKWTYKIIYLVCEKEVRVLEIIHTSRNVTAIGGLG